MPPPERMLTTLKKATDATRGTLGRTGRLLQLNGATEILVAGDLHGNLPHFLSILKAADLANQPGRHLILQELIHSEFFYPNGGDKSHQLVDLFAALKCTFPERVHYLPGNHEIAQMLGRQIAKGAQTQNTLFAEGLKHAYGTSAVEIHKAYNELFRASPLAIRTPNGIFCCHTVIPAKTLPLFDPMKLLEEDYPDAEYGPGGMVYGLLWGRDTAQRTAEAFLRKVDADWLITGHIKTDLGYEVPNTKQLIVDCAETPGAYVLAPADRPVTLEEIVGGVKILE